MSIDVQLPAPVEGHARWCAGGCVRWLGSGAPTCLPMPCQCAATKAAAPAWRKDLGDVKCWWRKRTGGIDSRCPCWGADRDGKPGDCCSHHSANPRYLLTPEDGMLADPDAVMATLAEVPDRPADWHAPHERADWLDEPPAWEEERPLHKPYVRRWSAAETLCTCPPECIPKNAIHCPDCHVNWGNEMVHGMHRPGWHLPCRAPSALVDVDNLDVPLVYADHEGVWRMRWIGMAA